MTGCLQTFVVRYFDVVRGDPSDSSRPYPSRRIAPQGNSIAKGEGAPFVVMGSERFAETPSDDLLRMFLYSCKWW